MANKKEVLAFESARSLIDPLAEPLIGSVTDGIVAFEKFEQLCPELRKPLDNRARCAFVYCHMRQSAEIRFAGIPGVRVTTLNGFLAIDVQQKILLRLKKLNNKRFPSNYRTDAQVRIDGQLEFPGMPKATWINCGYILKPLGTSLKEIAVSCVLQSKLCYSWALGAEEVTLFNPAAPPPVLPQARVQVTPKKATAESKVGA